MRRESLFTSTERPQTRTTTTDTAGWLVSLFDSAQLSPAMRRIAKYVISNPRDTLFLSAAQLAMKVGVSQPSVSRMVQAMGYSTYTEFQRHLREMVLAAAPPPSPPNSVRDAIANDIVNLEALASNVDTPAGRRSIRRVAAGFMKSRPLIVTGSRVSAPLAAHFSFLAAKIHPDVRCITEIDTGHDRLTQAAGSGDQWLLAYLLPRYASTTVSLLGTAKKLGYLLAVVVDRPLRLLDDLADEIIYAPTGRTLTFDSYATAMVMSSILLDAMGDADPEGTQSRLKSFEEMAEKQRIFRSE